MKKFRIGHLDVAVTSAPRPKRVWDRVVYIDWRLLEEGKRWRLQFSNQPLWIAMGVPRPTKHNRLQRIIPWTLVYWAFWARGND